MNRSLPNYIRTFRRRVFLSQEELSFLLGRASGTSVVRHETGQRLPTLETALAYAAILQVDPRQLFAGHYQEQVRVVRTHADRLLASVKHQPATEESREKILFLEVLVHNPEPLVLPCEQ